MIQSTYELIDSGDYAKLEKIGPHLIVRPCPQAVWEPRDPAAWKKATDTYVRNNTGSGKWQKGCLPDEWHIDYHGQKMLIRPTAFGHLGLFPEHARNWDWVAEQCTPPGCRAMNLFAYTGGLSLAMARAGAQVAHVDAAKGICDWARDNAELNKISNIRWIVDDVLKFLQREARRDSKYDAIVLDPPTYGRGPKGEIWKIEEQINPLLKDIKAVLSDKPRFVLFSCHTPHFTPKALENLCHSVFGDKIKVDAFEMTVPEKNSKRVVPSGFCCRVTFA